MEKKSLEIDAKLAEVAVEFRDIENGHLVRFYSSYKTFILSKSLQLIFYLYSSQAEQHHEKALKGLLKRCRSGTEEFMRLLENLDAMRSVHLKE